MGFRVDRVEILIVKMRKVSVLFGGKLCDMMILLGDLLILV